MVCNDANKPILSYGVMGGQVNLGDRPNGANWQNPNIQSEFGRLTNAFYFELKCYF